MDAQELQQKIYETMEALDKLILPQPDPKTGEFGQTGVYASRRANAEFMKENSVDGDKKAEPVLASAASVSFSIAENLRPQATDLVAYAHQELTAAIAELFADTIPMMDGETEAENIEKAIGQVRQMIDGIKAKWLNKAENHRTKLLKRLSKGGQEVESEEIDGNKEAAVA